MNNDPLAPYRRELSAVSRYEQAEKRLTQHHALNMAISALNQIPNHTLSGVDTVGYLTTDALLPVLDNVYERGNAQEQHRALGVAINVLNEIPDHELPGISTENYTSTKALVSALEGLYERASPFPEITNKSALEQEVTKQPDIEPEM